MREAINEAVKAAMRSGEKRKLTTLRTINAKIKDADLAGGPGKDRIPDGEIADLLAKMIKQRRESIEAFRKGGREELAAQEEEEIAIIQAYLPKGLDESEARAAIDAALKETGAASVKDMGKVMALLKERFAGRMDFAKASAAVKERLK